MNPVDYVTEQWNNVVFMITLVLSQYVKSKPKIHNLILRVGASKFDFSDSFIQVHSVFLVYICKIHQSVCVCSSSNCMFIVFIIWLVDVGSCRSWDAVIFLSIDFLKQNTQHSITWQWHHQAIQFVAQQSAALQNSLAWGFQMIPRLDLEHEDCLDILLL